MALTQRSVITVRSDFQEYARAYKRAAASAHLVIAKHLAWIAEAAESIGVPTLMEFTPVETGRLRASTEAHVYQSVGASGAMQAVVEFDQPAENRGGEEYAPFVILGTRYIRPNPYNRSAYEVMAEPMDALYMLAGRQIAEDLTTFMRVAA